jgi:hypothetical protein
MYMGSSFQPASDGYVEVVATASVFTETLQSRQIT